MGVSEGAVLPEGSLILVTGANGLVGLHIVDQFLRAGYKVRGTVRDTQKNAWISEYFEEQYGGGKFELVEVKDLANVESLKKVLEGCAGFASAAADVSFGPDPNVVITPAIKLTQATLEAAAATPSVKRFVLTSSSMAADHRAGEKYDLGTDSWNTAALEAAWAPPPYDRKRSAAVYSASKVAAEKEAWKFVEERKPGFVLNTVLPDFVVGKIFNQEKQGAPSSMGILKGTWDGNFEIANQMPPQYEIDAEDVGMLHVAAMLHPEAKGERIFGLAYPKNVTNTIQNLRELYPQRRFMDPPAGEQEFLANVVGRPRAEERLRWVKGSGWTTYKQSLKKACDPWV